MNSLSLLSEDDTPNPFELANCTDDGQSSLIGLVACDSGVFMRFPLYFWRIGLEPLLRQLRFIVLTTRGRRSGEPRRVMLEHSCIHDRVYIAPGWGERTQWYLNILADPRVTAQRNGKTFGVTAHLVTEDTELTLLYHAARAGSPVWKQYLASRGVEDTLEDFIAKKDRLPAPRLDPIAGDAPLPPLRRDLWWVWAVLAVVGLLLWWLL